MSRPIDHEELDAAASSLMTTTAFAPGSRGAFVEAWYRQVREVDDATMAHLMRLLLRLRRIKNALAAIGFVGGGLIFGVLPVDGLLHAALIHGTLAAMVGFPTLATGSLAVRRIFLKEAMRLGLSRSTAMLLLTRAERRARFQRPGTPDDETVDQLIAAVHAWDQA